MGTINFNDGPPYDRLDIASAQATAASDGVEVALTAYVFGQPAATVPFKILLDPAVARFRFGIVAPGFRDRPARRCVNRRY